MRIVILGGGPAGLYAAYLLKRARAALDVRVLEQNPRDATFGFGVVFSDRALDFLRADDPETCAAIAPHMETWDDITLFHRGESVAIDGVGFSAIGRLELLRHLQARAEGAGARLEFGRPVAAEDVAALAAEADLLLGADGYNSPVRHGHEEAFGASMRFLDNRFAWYGTTRVFETLSHTFVDTPAGPFNAHHYRYAPGMSTFLAECGPEAFAAAGLEAMDEAGQIDFCEAVFAEALQGHRLVSNRSIWRRFPVVRCRTWWHGNKVLLGDALRTAHFSIGSGTRLAMEDALALVGALVECGFDVARALPLYQERRRPAVDKLCAAADTSAAWYEDFGTHMKLPPREFAMSYITRSGRVDPDRLRRLAPRFMAAYEGAA